jgi:hypothetical protein
VYTLGAGYMDFSDYAVALERSVSVYRFDAVLFHLANPMYSIVTTVTHSYVNTLPNY